MTSSGANVTLASGHRCFPLGEADDSRILKSFPTYTDGAMRLSPGGWFLLNGYRDVADKIYNFKLRSTDVVTMTFPKSGTTWCQEVIWTMLHDPDLTGKPRSPLMQRAPYLEMEVDQWPAKIKNFTLPLFEAMCPGQDPPSSGITLRMLEEEEDPRVIKTHLPLSLLPRDTLEVAKVVYVARNPKDLLVSFYDYSCIQKRLRFQGSLEAFADFFVQDEMRWSPYWEHIREAWEQRNHPNLHFLFFEDLRNDSLAEYGKLNEFLGAGLTEEQIRRVMEYTSFSNMKARNDGQGKDSNIISEGSFFRAGRTENFKQRLTPALEAKIDAWTKENAGAFKGDFKYFL